MSPMRMYRASASDAGERLDVVMGAAGLYPSRSAASKAIEEGKVTINGSTASKKTKVSENDTIVYEFEEKVESPIEGEDIPLDIRYEDENLIVLSKQSGLVCHPCEDYPDGTLVNALIFHCGSDHLCNVQGEDDRLGIVHRLDAETSGLMLAAKTNNAGEALMADIAAHVVDRRYLALVHGVISIDTGMIDAPIARDVNNRKQMAVRDCPSAREAITTFTVLERFDPAPGDDGYTLIECKLFTGRTHQIRVHMQYTKHPVVGDPIYTKGAPKKANASLGLTRQFLHSYKLGFEHPITGVYLEFEDELPDDLANALNALRFQRS